MKIKDGFVLRQVASSYVVMNIGGELSFNKMITLNESGALIWNALADGLSAEEAAKRITSEYEVSYEVALNDVNSFIEKMKEAGVIE
ncbi:MAG: PqqD family protein [Clostridia bacterium]|nr:PqqD family protein [Clostridia bacterium]